MEKDASWNHTFFHLFSFFCVSCMLKMFSFPDCMPLLAVFSIKQAIKFSGLLKTNPFPFGDSTHYSLLDRSNLSCLFK